MRLWHLLFGIFAVSLALTIAREPAGRVAVIVFVAGLGAAVVATFALLALFQTIGAIGEADRAYAHAEAIVATGLVLILATLVMNGLFFVGGWMVCAAVP